MRKAWPIRTGIYKDSILEEIMDMSVEDKLNNAANSYSNKHSVYNNTFSRDWVKSKKVISPFFEVKTKIEIFSFEFQNWAHWKHYY